MKERLDFLIELSRTTQEELMFRIEHRDRWLTHQLLAQAILIGLALGFNIGGVEQGASPPPNPTGFVVTRDMILVLAIPVSLVLTLMYAVEDQLIGKIGQWRGGLALQEAGLSGATNPLSMWENSNLLHEYGHSALRHRMWGQMLAFIFVPGLCFLFTAFVQRPSAAKVSPEVYFPIYYGIWALELLLAITIFRILKSAYGHRLERYLSLGTPPVVSAASAELKKPTEP